MSITRAKEVGEKYGKWEKLISCNFYFSAPKAHSGRNGLKANAMSVNLVNMGWLGVMATPCPYGNQHQLQCLFFCIFFKVGGASRLPCHGKFHGGRHQYIFFTSSPFWAAFVRLYRVGNMIRFMVIKLPHTWSFFCPQACCYTHEKLWKIKHL